MKGLVTYCYTLDANHDSVPCIRDKGVLQVGVTGLDASSDYHILFTPKEDNDEFIVYGSFRVDYDAYCGVSFGEVASKIEDVPEKYAKIDQIKYGRRGGRHKYCIKIKK